MTARIPSMNVPLAAQSRDEPEPYSLPAKIMSGVRVALVAKNGEDLGAGTTDAGGKVRFPRPMLKGEGAAAAKMVMAYGAMGGEGATDVANMGLARAAAVDRVRMPQKTTFFAPKPLSGMVYRKLRA